MTATLAPAMHTPSPSVDRGIDPNSGHLTTWTGARFRILGNETADRDDPADLPWTVDVYRPHPDGHVNGREAAYSEWTWDMPTRAAAFDLVERIGALLVDATWGRRRPAAPDPDAAPLDRSAAECAQSLWDTLGPLPASGEYLTGWEGVRVMVDRGNWPDGSLRWLVDLHRVHPAGTNPRHWGCRSVWNSEASTQTDAFRLVHLIGKHLVEATRTGVAPVYNDSLPAYSVERRATNDAEELWAELGPLPASLMPTE